jgi:hypothetical protein
LEVLGLLRQLYVQTSPTCKIATFLAKKHECDASVVVFFIRLVK